MSHEEDDRPQLLPRGLPIELYHQILCYIAPDHESTLHIDRAVIRRQFLSVESIQQPDPPSFSVRDIGRFRCACKRFADIGAPFLFTQVTTRFSTKGLRRLDQLAQWGHLARHVKRFSYLVPYFFEGGLNNLDEIKEELREVGLRPSDLRVLRHKASEQRDIIAREDDVRVLTSAIRSFTSLQLIQLLRAIESQDGIVLEYLKTHTEARRNVNLDWTSACKHASLTIGTALLASQNVQWNRFSLPAVSPASARFLKATGPDSIAMLAERLTCLTLHFDDNEELDYRIQDLSEVFKTVFQYAKKMKAVHLGFPSTRQVNLPLESIFHHVVWDDLVAFGVQGWELHADEIIGFLNRHKVKLRCVRLREVHLKEGSMWRDVLSFLRSEMHQLLWVSLRNIEYAAYVHSPEYPGNSGAELPPFFSDSEDEDELNSDDDHVAHGQEHDEDDSEEDSRSEEESGDEYGHEMEFPNLNSPTTPTSPRCTCGGRGYLESVEDLDDDGWRIADSKRKLWEKWALWRCPVHGSR